MNLEDMLKSLESEQDSLEAQMKLQLELPRKIAKANIMAILRAADVIANNCCLGNLAIEADDILKEAGL